MDRGFVGIRAGVDGRVLGNGPVIPVQMPVDLSQKVESRMQKSSKIR